MFGNRSRAWPVGALLAALFMIAQTQAVMAAPRSASDAVAVNADFAGDNGPGHAEVFGSSINLGALTDPKKIETLHQSGTRFIRGDVYLGDVLPNTTIPAYLAAMGAGTGVADPNTWNWSKYDWIDEHHGLGAKTLLILSYSVPWLGYLPNGDTVNYSPPRGADGLRVYGDVVKKIYQRFRGKVDLIEVWNEPDNIFLDLTGSPYPNNPRGRVAAYKDMYAAAANAIRTVDTKIPIGGPVKSNSDPVQYGDTPADNVDWAKEMLTDPNVAGNVDFLSYHNYNDYTSHPTEDVAKWKQAARAAGRTDDFPVYVTEWNYDYHDDVNPMDAYHPNTIAYTGDRLTEFLKQHTDGTNFYADNDEAANRTFFGVHADGMLPPKSRTYRLLSVDLGLGDGQSTLRPVTYPASISNAGAATTAGGNQVAWVVNYSATPQAVDLTMSGLGGMSATTASVFEASPNQTQVQPKASVPLTVSGGAATIHLAAPAYSVVGVRLAPYPIADGENLATSAKITPSSVNTEYPELDGSRVADGVIGVHGVGEWASKGELTPNIRLDWTTPKTVGEVVLYDRANPTDRMLAGRLEFSDGSSVQVPQLPNDGTGKAVSFAARDVTWLRFVVTSGAGLNVGLSELQVFAGANVARAGTVTTSSQADLGPHGQLKAIDGITTAAGEWVSTETNPWLRIDWVNSHTVDRVVLFDRGGSAHANSGTLTFSDGTSVPVTGIPTDGSAKVVSFPARPVTWVRFQVTGGSGSGVGLAEFRVLAAGNLASSAVATASSVAPDTPELGPAGATDGVINQWYAGEWAANREANPWIRLSWTAPQTIGQVVLYDRSNLIDFATGGTLTFSDGTSLEVTGMDDNGTGKVVRFAPRAVTWVQFRATESSTSWNGGLSEFEAFAA